MSNQNSGFEIKAEQRQSWQTQSTASWQSAALTAYGAVSRCQVLPAVVWFFPNRDLLHVMVAQMGDRKIPTPKK